MQVFGPIYMFAMFALCTLVASLYIHFFIRDTTYCWELAPLPSLLPLQPAGNKGGDEELSQSSKGNSQQSSKVSSSTQSKSS
mmetsp:Transcript_5134/g.8733  ORF Transcript_5134/g.8733 Transcript_5134/m.8733 type:complete len:82 (-) Transcript_5134:384-629(-)